MASKRETQKSSIGKAKASIQRPRPDTVVRIGLPESLPTSVQKSYFMLGEREREILNHALEKYRPGRTEPILIGGANALKPALKLMSFYRPRIDEVKEDAVVASYTRWLEAVIVKGTENQEVYVTFSPLFERIWLESKKRLPEYVAKEPGNIRLRSQYSIRLYAWAKTWASVRKKRISLEDLRKVLGLESVRDAEGKVIQEPPLPIWANFRQRALDTAIAEITKKTDLRIEVESLERSKHRRVTSVTFSIQEQVTPDGE
jgi:plasmid replication initiation protein